MAENQIEIEVELTGTQKVNKQIQKVEGGLQDLGETGSKLATTMGATNKKLGEGLESVAGSVGEVRGAFSELGTAVKNLGQTGAKGIMGLLGPLGLLAGAALSVYQSFRLITGAAQEAEEAEEAMRAAAADLQSKLEMLAEKGVIPTTEELQKFSLAVLESQLAKEEVEIAMRKYRKEFKALTSAKRRATKVAREEAKAAEIGGRVYIDNLMAQKEAEKEIVESRERVAQSVAAIRDVQVEAIRTLQAAGEQELAFEQRATVTLKANAKRLANLQKELFLIKARQDAKGDELAIADAEASAAIRMIKLEEELTTANTEQTQSILKRLEASELAISAEGLELEKLREKQKEILKKENEERRKNLEKRRQDSKRAADQQRREQERLAKEAEANRRREILLDSQLRTLTIQETQTGIAQLISLESEKHQTVLALTKDGSKERLIEEKRFRMALNQIILDNTKQQQEEEIALRYEFAERLKEIEGAEQTLFGTDIEALNAESQQRLDLLKLQFDKEVELARVRGEDLTAIQKRYSLERLAIEKETVQQQADILSGYFDQYGQGFAEAAVGALLFGENFQEATSQILLGLAEQAGVRSIMSFAEGFAQLALGDPRAAASFKAGALFAGAAVIAGASGKGLAEGGGGATPTATPTGTPTTAPTPQREEVRQEGMVFNINFGGAVVYDTKKAAEQALADRLVTIMNTSRRGSPRIGR